MRPERKAKVRDRRKPGWFRVDDEIIGVYGPKIGVHGIAVYAAICKYADKDESSHPSLRTLCETLKIGRKKLLDTLALLKELGLIDIDPGDRANVSVYTLLDVPKKGGSNENHVVLTETTGGSEKHDLGGSNENRNQTQIEPDPVEPEVVDDTTARCLQLLLQVKGFPRDQGENALKLAEYRQEFRDADPIEVCRDFAAFISEKPFKKGDKPRLRLRNFFKQANKSRNGYQKNGTKPTGAAPLSTARRKAGYEWLFDSEAEEEKRDLDAELKAMRESA